jgi:methionyl-tRNA formyltransferase
MKKDLRIIFMGTPDFAIPSLRILIESGYHIVAVITAQDKPRGRGRKLTPPPVKSFAQEHNIPVLQPPNLKDSVFVDELKSFKANLQVVVAFRMLPEVVWSMPEYGTFNLHASLLPNYRGAAPINWVLINGETRTGLTTFFIKHEIDTGNIIFLEEVDISYHDDAGSLHDKLMIRGADLVLKTVRAIEEDSCKVKVQEDKPELKKAPKIFREMCEIDWNQDSTQVYNFVRGLSPFPGAWVVLNNKMYKIFRVQVLSEDDQVNAPGVFETDSKSFLNIQCSKGIVTITELQPEGKRKMKIEDFFRGNQL